MRLENTVALVTGAAHRVGKGIALALAREGAHIVIHYGRSADAAADTADELAALGVETLLAQADLADPAQIGALFDAVEKRFGRLDVLVNSAASFERQPFDAIGVEDWDRVLAVNLRAPFLCTQRAAHLMRATPRPEGETAAIVNISDLSGVFPWHGYTQHGVSKAGLLHLTRIAARELGPEIRVNAILPGAILPPPGMDPDGEAWQAGLRRLPLARAGHPGQVGDAVVFLAQAEYTTGAALTVDGGEHLVGVGGG
jgi:pteridine reductase